MRQTARLAFIVAVFLLGQLPALFSSLTAHAQTTVYPTPTPAPTQTKDMRVLSQTVVMEVTAAIGCQLAGIDVVDARRPCIGMENNIRADGTPKLGGLLGAGSSMIGGMYDMPIHTSEYVNHLAGNFGIAKPAYAQNGVGFNSLNPVLGLWTKFRDMTYFGFVIIMIIIGAGIMLRLKIDPRTVMTIQNQIPKIIVSLLLITFSYAIVGLLVDTMWLTTYFGINFLTEQAECDYAGPQSTRVGFTEQATKNILSDPYSYTSTLFSDPDSKGGQGCFGEWQGVSGLSTDVGGAVGDVVTRLLLETLGWGEPQDWDCGIISGSIGDCFKQVVKLIITPLASLIVFIAISLMLFRVWFTLLKSYIYVIVYTMLGPLWIFMGVIPFSSQGFGNWIRGLLANLAVFPGTAFLLVTASVIATDPRINSQQAQARDYFILPLIGNPSLPGHTGALIAFGILLIAPEVINITRQIFKAPASKYTAAITKGAGAGSAIAGAGGGAVWNRITRPYDVQSGKEAGILRQLLAGKPVTPAQGQTFYAAQSRRYKIVESLFGGKK